MNKMLNQIKKIMAWFGNHLFAAILGVVITSSITVSVIIIFWKWLKTKHSLEMYGFLWIVVVFVLIVLPLFIFWLLKKKKMRIQYHKDNEILVVLEHKLREYDRQNKNEILLDF